MPGQAERASDRSPPCSLFSFLTSPSAASPPASRPDSGLRKIRDAIR